MLRKLKGLLGFCQCNKCWGRAYADAYFGSKKNKRVICLRHFAELLKDCTPSETKL